MMPTEEQEKMITECYLCKHKEDVPGNCYIKCNKPDSNMIGDKIGIKYNCFSYPFLFDPKWKTKFCDNYQIRGRV